MALQSKRLLLQTLQRSFKLQEWLNIAKSFGTQTTVTGLDHLYRT
jgi:hypothetical protein